MLYPIIMAGGVGTRLWPISRKGKPKQVFPLLDHETLLQKTWKRLRRGFPARRIYVTTGAHLVEEVLRQLPRQLARNLTVEPVRRGNAPGLALALLKLLKRDPYAVFVYINADNFIQNEKEFLRLLKVAEMVVRRKADQLVCIGVNPTHPETGYGYIKMGRPVLRFPHTHRHSRAKGHGDEIFAVEKFVEKPDLKTARAFLGSWRYLWNPTLIVARVDHFLSLYKKHLPAMWRVLSRIERAIDSPQEAAVIKKEFSKITSELIEYGILEKEKSMLVLPGNFGWADVGHWKAVQEILSGYSETGSPPRRRSSLPNICKAGKCVSVDSSGNLIYSLSGKLVALAGVKNMILIESENALLLCPKSRAQEVKKLVEKLEKKGLKEYL